MQRSDSHCRRFSWYIWLESNFLPHSVSGLFKARKVDAVGALSSRLAAQGATVDINDSVLTNNLERLERSGPIRRQDRPTSPIWKLRHKPKIQASRPSWRSFNASTRLCFCSCGLCRMPTRSTPILRFNRSCQKQQQDALKAGFQDTANYASTYQTHVAPAYNGGAQALTY